MTELKDALVITASQDDVWRRSAIDVESQREKRRCGLLSSAIRGFALSWFIDVHPSCKYDCHVVILPSKPDQPHCVSSQRFQLLV